MINEFNELFELMGDFSKKTFPDAGSIEHLKKLKDEADEAIKEPKDISEYADCFLALIGAASKAGFTPQMFLEASFDKFEILKVRKWQRLPNGSYQHIKQSFCSCGAEHSNEAKFMGQCNYCLKQIN